MSKVLIPQTFFLYETFKSKSNQMWEEDNINSASYNNEETPLPESNYSGSGNMAMT